MYVCMVCMYGEKREMRLDTLEERKVESRPLNILLHIFNCGLCILLQILYSVHTHLKSRHIVLSNFLKYRRGIGRTGDASGEVERLAG